MKAKTRAYGADVALAFPRRADMRSIKRRHNVKRSRAHALHNFMTSRAQRAAIREGTEHRFWVAVFLTQSLKSRGI